MNGRNSNRSFKHTPIGDATDEERNYSFSIACVASSKDIFVSASQILKYKRKTKYAGPLSLVHGKHAKEKEKNIEPSISEMQPEQTIQH